MSVPSGKSVRVVRESASKVKRVGFFALVCSSYSLLQGRYETHRLT